MHRSGTSALARCLGLAGCHQGGPGDFNAADDANPRGYWERRDVWRLDEDLLSELGGSWRDVSPIDLERLPSDRAAHYLDRARAVVAALDRHRPWVVKDPRLCLLFPLWRRVLSAPVAVLIHRGPLAVARSLAARDGLPLALGAALWERYLRSALEATAGLPRCLVHYENLIDRPRETLAALLADLASAGVAGLAEPEAAALAEFLDPRLERQPRDPEAERGLLNAGQLELLDAIAGGSALAGPIGPLTLGAADLLARHGERERFVDALIRESERVHALLADSTANAAREIERLREQVEVAAAAITAERAARRTLEENAEAALGSERHAREELEETARALTAQAQALLAKIAGDTRTFELEHAERLRLEEELKRRA